MIDTHRMGNFSGPNSEDRTRESVGQVHETSYHENGDLNSIRGDDGGGGTLTKIHKEHHGPNVHSNHLHCHPTSLALSNNHSHHSHHKKAPPQSKRRTALFTCFTESIFYFKSPKRDRKRRSAAMMSPDHQLHYDNKTGEGGGGGFLAATGHRINMSVSVPRLKKLHSVDSANTISNSSLQEMDDEEFNSSDLVKYMEEINLGIKC